MSGYLDALGKAGISMIKVIVMGTDPASNLGGISFALRGYLDALGKAGISFEMIPTHRWQECGGKYKLWLKAIPRVVQLIRLAKHEGYIPIIYCHAGAAPSLLRKVILLVLCRFLGAKTVLQLHSIGVNGYLQKMWTRVLFKWGIASVDLLCVLSPWWKQKLKAYGISTPIAVIPNPMHVDLEKRARIRRSVIDRKQENILLICSVSRFEQGKGLDIAIESMQFLPARVHLIIGGSGSQEKQLRALVDRLDLQDRVFFLGWLNEKEKQDLMDVADVFCLPSSYDSFGMGFMEAMAHGLPVVALNYGPIADVVPDGRAGILAKEANPRSIANAIKTMMNKNIREEMSMAGQQWVLSEFSAEKVGKSLREAFETMVTGQTIEE